MGTDSAKEAQGQYTEFISSNLSDALLELMGWTLEYVKKKRPDLSEKTLVKEMKKAIKRM